MQNTYKIKTNFFNTSNRNLPLNQKSSYAALRTDPAYYNQDISKSINYSSKNEGLNSLLSKALSKKKRRGILDISSPGNKDVLTDSDSEMATSKNSKNMEVINKNMHKKNGCAKLIIEKIESQAPKRNEEYYKFTNQRKLIDNNDSIYGYKRYNNNRLIRANSPSNNLNKSIQYNNINNNRKPIVQTRGYTNPKGYQNSNINNRNKNYDSNYKQSNYRLATDSTNDKRYNTGNNQNISQNNISNYKGNKSNIMYKSSESSFDKGYNSFNYIGNKNSNIRRNNITENEFSTPLQSHPNNDDSYQSKKTMGLKKNLAPNNRPQKTISLYNSYKDMAKKPTINQLINLNYNTKSSKTYLQKKFNEKLIKSITKIQSFWRGAFIRELMTFVGKLNRFIDILYKIFQNNEKKYFIHFLNNLRNYEKPKKKISIGGNLKGPSMRQKYIYSKDKNDTPNKSKNSEEKLKSNKKEVKSEEDNNEYKNLLNDYNTLMDKYNKLMQEMNKLNENNANRRNKFDYLDIEKNELGIIDQKIKKIKNDVKIIRKSKDKINDIKVDKDKVNEEKKKKFDIIEPEQKEELKIIQKSNNNYNLRFRGRKQFKKQIEKIEKTSEIKYEGNSEQIKDNNKNIQYADFLNHFKENINVANNEGFMIEELPNINKTVPNLIPFDIASNSLTLINKKRKKSKKEEKIEIKEDKKEIDFNDEKEIKEGKKIKEDKKIEENKEIKEAAEEIKENMEIKEENKDNQNTMEEKLTTPKIFKNLFINKENEILIKNKKKEKKKKSKEKRREQKENYLGLELKEENQINLNTEIKGIDNKKLKIFSECIVNEHNNNINIIQIKKPKEFDKELILAKTDISVNIICENKPKEADINIKNEPRLSNTFNMESLLLNNHIELNIIGEAKNKTSEESKGFIEEKKDEIKLLEIENKDEDTNKDKDNNKFKDYTVEKKDNILLLGIKNKEIEKDNKPLEENEQKNNDVLLKVKEEDKNKEKKFDEILMIENNNILYIKKLKKTKYDKMTEITEELNKIEPNNHYELVFEGKINLDQNIEKLEKVEKDLEKKDNMEKVENMENLKLRNKNNRKNKKHKNKGKKEISNTPEEIICTPEEEKKKNDNEENEVEKGDGKEINSSELKNEKKNPNNIIISYENKLEVLYNKNAPSFTEKAKRNMMKIILPIRLKTVLREHIRKRICPLLIKALKQKE